MSTLPCPRPGSEVATPTASVACPRHWPSTLMTFAKKRKVCPVDPTVAKVMSTLSRWAWQQRGRSISFMNPTQSWLMDLALMRWMVMTLKDFLMPVVSHCIPVSKRVRNVTFSKTTVHKITLFWAGHPLQLPSSAGSKTITSISLCLLLPLLLVLTLKYWINLPARHVKKNYCMYLKIKLFFRFFQCHGIFVPRGLIRLIFSFSINVLDLNFEIQKPGFNNDAVIFIRCVTVLLTHKFIDTNVLLGLACDSFFFLALQRRLIDWTDTPRDNLHFCFQSQK